MVSAARLQRFISKAAGNTQPACAYARAIRFAGTSLRRPLTAFHIHIDEPPLKTDITHMADETGDPTIRLLREIRAAQEATNARLDETNVRLGETNAKLDGFITSTDKKLDKLNIELIGVKGRVRKVEEAIESIARVMSDGALG
jgi:hypothetical protein